MNPFLSFVIRSLHLVSFGFVAKVARGVLDISYTLPT